MCNKIYQTMLGCEGSGIMYWTSNSAQSEPPQQHIYQPSTGKWRILRHCSECLNMNLMYLLSKNCMLKVKKKAIVVSLLNPSAIYKQRVTMCLWVSYLCRIDNKH